MSLNARATPRRRISRVDLWVLVAIMLVAACLRFVWLEDAPPGVHYDEAGNWIIGRQVARGETFPIFVTAYAGREAMFHWLAGALMALGGPSLFVFRLSIAVAGLLTLPLTYALARELFADWEPGPARWLALAAVALAATSFWHVLFSRLGLRGMTQPLTQTAMLWATARGLRLERRGWLAAGGALCGLTAYTYLASRAVPFALLPLAVVLLASGTGRLRRRLGQLALFGLAALVVFAPLGGFFLRHPETFAVRMGQVSVFSPEINAGDLWGTLVRSALQAAGMFTVRGDDDPLYNFPGRPVFDPLIGAAFYLGLAVSVWQLFSRQGTLSRLRWLLLATWVPIMLLPSVLGAREVPQHLRAIGTMPVVYLLPALGLTIVGQGLGRLWRRVRLPHPARTGQRGNRSRLPVLALGLLLAWQGSVAGVTYLDRWAHDPATFYRTHADLRAAADYLAAHPHADTDLFFLSDAYRLPSLAALSPDYESIHWLVGGQVMVLPSQRPALYFVQPHYFPPASWLMQRFFPAEALQARVPGPDGTVALEVYQLEPGRMPAVAPQYPQVPQVADFGHSLELLGYDVSPTVAGQTLALTLYWRVLASPEAGDTMLFVHLEDAWGWTWSSSDRFDYPAAEWRPGQVIVQRREVPIPPLAPPGDYTPVIGLYSPSRNARLPLFDAGGRVAGTALKLHPVPVAAAAAPADAAGLAMRQPLQAGFGSLHLLGFDYDRAAVRQGEALALGLFWQAAGDLPDLNVALHLEGEDGATLPLTQGAPVHGTYPTAAWPAGAVVLDRHGLQVPQEWPAGTYRLILTVTDAAGGQPLGEPVTLLSVDVEAVDRRTVVPPMQHVLAANLGGQVELLGYDLDRTSLVPGEALHLTLYWRALAPMPDSYTVFTHLLDGAGQVQGQQDNPPVGGSYPTTLWAPGEVVSDAYTLASDPGAPPGQYQVEIGMYLAETGQRLPVLDARGQSATDRVLLDTTIEVVEVQP